MLAFLQSNWNVRRLWSQTENKPQRFLGGSERRINQAWHEKTHVARRGLRSEEHWRSTRIEDVFFLMCISVDIIKNVFNLGRHKNVTSFAKCKIWHRLWKMVRLTPSAPLTKAKRVLLCYPSVTNCRRWAQMLFAVMVRTNDSVPRGLPAHRNFLLERLFCTTGNIATCQHTCLIHV